jgi:chromate transporter
MINPILIVVEFFRVGLFTIGGGLATLPFLYELAGRTHWFEPERIPDFLAVAQMLPGAIGINTIASAGMDHLGPLAAVLAVLGAVSPSIIIIILVSITLNKIRENVYIQAVFSGIKPAAAGMLAAICAVLILEVVSGDASFKLKEAVLFAALFILIMVLKKHPELYIALGGLAGYFLF